MAKKDSKASKKTSGETPKEESTTSSETIEVISPKEAKPTGNVLIVELTKGSLPIYKFKGQWSGKDIGVVVRTIRRAYHLRNRDIRNIKEGKPTLKGAITNKPVEVIHE